MIHEYSTNEQETSMASEPVAQYATLEINDEAIMCAPQHPRTITEEEIAHCFTLKEFKQHMDDIVESTHNHAAGCVEHTPVVPRKCSFKEAQQRSMTVEQFTGKLYAMVDDFYRKKA